MAVDGTTADGGGMSWVEGTRVIPPIGSCNTLADQKRD